MRRLRLAVVGVGHLGRIHARLAATAPEIDLCAIVDPRPEARAEVSAEVGAKPLADYLDLLGEVDAAVVATPTSTHRQVAGELIRGGVHVLVEKPLAPTAREAEELVQLARSRHVVLQVGHVERFNPALVSVRSLLDEPKFIEARRQSGYTFRSTDVGVVMDLMIHDIDVALSLVKAPVSSVDAIGISVLGDHEDMVSARLHFANGAVASLTASRTSYAAARTMHVFTGMRFASIDFAARRSTVVEPRRDVLSRQLQLAQIAPNEQQSLRQRMFEDVLVKREAPAEETNAIEQELRDFASAVQSGRAPQVTGADGRDAVAVAEMILAEISNHAWDGANSRRVGPLASPILPLPLVDPDAESSSGDTVIIRRKAG